MREEVLWFDISRAEGETHIELQLPTAEVKSVICTECTQYLWFVVIILYDLRLPEPTTSSTLHCDAVSIMSQDLLIDLAAFGIFVLIRIVFRICCSSLFSFSFSRAPALE